MDLKTYCDQERGRQAALAAAIKVPPVSISNWAGRKRPVPLTHVLPIERVTQGCVTRRELRPDDWHVYWPEQSNADPIPPISTPSPCSVVEISQAAAIGDVAGVQRDERAAA